MLADDANVVAASVDQTRIRLGQPANTERAVKGNLITSTLFTSIKNNLVAANGHSAVYPKADLSSLINFEQGKYILATVFNNASIAATTIYNNTCQCNCDNCDCDCDRCSCNCDRCACDCDQCGLVIGDN
jgi:hypothetical protein